jgi:methylglutaconyl-CoA hydratase
MTQTESLLVTVNGPRADVTLNRPEVRNAFDDALVQALADAAHRLGADHAVRVVVLRGAGKVFCAGADVGWMQRMVRYTEKENLHDASVMAAMFQAWNALPKPVVGRIQGAAIGGGTGLAAVCDIAVADDDTVFAFSEVRLGILPAVISPFVLAKIGEAAARDLFLTGDRFPAQRALAIGLVQRLAPPHEFDATVDAVVQAVLAGGPEAQARIKTLIPQVLRDTPGETRALTARAIARARASAEGQEGLRAFLDRRKATWRGDA